MDYFNYFNGANLYPNPSTSFGGLETYPTQTSVTEQVGDENLLTFTNGWSTGGQPGDTVGTSASLRAEASFDSVSSVTTHTAQTDGYDQWAYPRHYQPIVGQHSQAYRTGIVSQDSSFTSAVELEASTAIPIPSIPHDHWGARESGPPTITFQANVGTRYQSSTGSTRTGMIQTPRFRPYETPRARSNEHTNAEAGPSNLAPPPVPYVAPPLTNPSGGITEATADAEHHRTITEEDTAPITRRPRGTGAPREGRLRYQENIQRLRVWAQGWKGSAKRLTHPKALGIALEAIQRREPVHSAPKLAKGAGRRTTEGKEASDAEYRRRTGIRQLNEELSRYYPIFDRQEWECPELLSKVLEEVQGLQPPATSPS